MPLKVRLMLMRSDGVADDALDHALRAEINRLDQSLPGRLEHHRAFHLPDASLRVAHKGDYYPGSRPFDAMWEIVADGEDLEPIAAALDGFAHRLAGLIEPASSAVLVGAPHTILPGTGKLHVAVAARRLPHLTHQGYLDYWFGNHAEEGRKTNQIISGLGYRQIHVDIAASEAVARRTGLALWDFDGMSETYMADADSLRAIYCAPGVWESAYPDELKFVDHGRSVSTLFVMADS